MLKRLVITGLFITFLLTSQSVWCEKASDKKYYDTGEIKSEGNKFLGYYKRYYKNGKLAYEGMYVMGKPNGLHKIYLPDGDRKSTRLNSSHSDRSRMPSSA